MITSVLFVQTIFTIELNFQRPKNKNNNNNNSKIKQWQLTREFCEYSHSPKQSFSEICKTRQTRRHSPSRVDRTRQTRRHLPKAIFEKNVTRLVKFARVLSESREFGASGHCLINIPMQSLQFKYHTLTFARNLRKKTIKVH